MYCMNCGKELPDDANFCLRCGKPTANKPSSEQTVTPQSTVINNTKLPVAIETLEVDLFGPQDYPSRTKQRKRVRVWFRLVDADGNATAVDGTARIKLYIGQSGHVF